VAIIGEIVKAMGEPEVFGGVFAEEATLRFRMGQVDVGGCRLWLE